MTCPSSLVLSVFFLISSVVLALGATGCAISESPCSSMQASADRQHVLTASNNGVSANDPAGVDDDFELLEEELVEEMVEVADPLEPVNRIMFYVNDRLYFWVARPVLQVYRDVMPEPARVGIRNFFNNVSTPVRLVNCLLQGKNAAAGTELHRFAINTTVGILGFGDPALDEYGVRPVKEDLGQTLAVYGLGDGFYVVWPLLGPSTVRDSVGKVGDMFLRPLYYLDSTEAAIALGATKGLNEYSFHTGEYEDFKAAALEPYVAMRELYVQYRNRQIQE